MNRRSFLLALASATAVGILTPYHRKLHQFNQSRQNPLRKQMYILTTLAEGVYPGIQEAGFESFLTRKLRRDKSQKLRNQLHKIAIKTPPLFQKRYGSSIEAAKRDQLEDFVQLLSTGKIDPKLKKECNRLIDLTLESAFSAPYHGGNLNSTFWRGTNTLFSPEWMNG